MKLTDLPDENDAEAIFVFALTFDGYERFGSFERSAKAASSGDRSSLDLIRNELFFAARASRHMGANDFLKAYRAILPLLRSFATADE